MASKIKVFVGFLALIALVSVLSLFDSFSNSSLSGKTANIVKSSISFAVDNDVDKDGLSNRDESYWNTDFQNPDTDGDGYLDGEEVASSHDPLIPSPNDLIDNDNLTAKLSNLTLAGLYEGSLKSNNPSFINSIGDLASSIADEADQNLTTYISHRPASIISTLENQNYYIKQISPLMENLFSTYIFGLERIGREESDNKIASFFKNQSEKYEMVLSDLSQISPPKNWESNHIGLRKLSGDLAKVHLAISENNTDPITASVAMIRLKSLLPMIPVVLNAYADKIILEELNTESTIFQK